MFGIGFSEMIIIAILAMLLIGPEQLPDLARTIGKFVNELKRSTNVIADELQTHKNEILNDVKQAQDQKKTIEKENPVISKPESSDV